MSNPDNPLLEPKPKPETTNGSFKLSELREGNAEEYRRILFRQPLEVDWWVSEESHEETPEKGIHVSVDLNRGLNWRNVFTTTSQHPASRLDGYTTEEIEASIKRMLKFEFAHSFFHYKEDPNYGIMNWAIYGNFKGDVTLEEKYDGIVETTPPEGKPAHPESVRGRRMTAHGLDPESATIFQLCCTEAGIDYRTASLRDLAIDKLQKLEVKPTSGEFTLEFIEESLGKDWIEQICQ